LLPVILLFGIVLFANTYFQKTQSSQSSAATSCSTPCSSEFAYTRVHFTLSNGICGNPISYTKDCTCKNGFASFSTYTNQCTGTTWIYDPYAFSSTGHSVNECYPDLAIKNNVVAFDYLGKTYCSTWCYTIGGRCHSTPWTSKPTNMEAVPGNCPGGSNIMCYRLKGTDTCTTTYKSTQGYCQPTYRSCLSSWVSGKCPGDYWYKCCTKTR